MTPDAVAEGGGGGTLSGAGSLSGLGLEKTAGLREVAVGSMDILEVCAVFGIFIPAREWPVGDKG
jgi:hypothetical protein